MARYGVELQRTAHATLSVGVMQCTATTRRLVFYDSIIGSEASPADNPFLWNYRRITTGSTTGTAVTPQALDSADGASNFDANENPTVDPTINAVPMLSVPLNQRATFRWVAAPGSEIVSPATDNTGLAILTPTQSAVLVTATTLVNEI